MNERNNTSGKKPAPSPKKSPAKNKKTKRPEERGLVLSALKNFGITFLACMIVFGLVASFAVTLITSTVDDILKTEKSELDSILSAQDDEAQASTDDDSFEVPAGESFSSLVVVTDYDPDYFTYYPDEDSLEDSLKEIKKEYKNNPGALGAGYRNEKAKYIVIIRADKDKREYTITPLASCTRVYTPIGYKLLGDVYAYYGPEFFVQKVSALTGIGIDYYYFMNVTEAPDIIKEIGSFTVDLASDIYSDGASYGTKDGVFGDVTAALPPEEFLETEAETEEETEAETEETQSDDTEEEDGPKERAEYGVSVRAGTVTVTDSNIKDLLMFENFKNGVDERCDLMYQLAKGTLARIAAMPEGDMVTLFSKVCAYANYDEFTDKLYDDGYINTDMDTPIFAKKTALVSAYLKFTITKLDFPGKFVSNYFVPSLTEGTSKMAEYKLPADPEKE